MITAFKHLYAAALLALALPAAAATPEGQDLLQVYNQLPTKKGDALFSFSVEWRIDDGELFRTNGMTFLNADKIDANTTPLWVTKKLVNALKEGLMQLDPGLRGVTVQQKGDAPQLTIANRAGYSVTNIVVRDYSNQALAFDIGGKTLASANVQAALDLVLAADVEYLDGFSAHKSQTAGPGEIEVRIDQQAPVSIQTEGKTTKQLEQELARQLNGAKIAETALFPPVIHTDTRNIKPFDGSEIQFAPAAFKHIAVQVRSPSLGVLSKFKYPDDNASVNVAQPKQMLALLPLVVALVIGFFWWRARQQNQ
jgi:hypothetical protein